MSNVVTLRFLHGAAADLDEGFLFYEKKEPGVGQQFILEVQNAIERIQQDPDRWASSAKGTKRCRVHRFPYDVIFRPSPDELLIVAIMQLNRRPGYWKDRI